MMNPNNTHNINNKDQELIVPDWCRIIRDRYGCYDAYDFFDWDIVIEGEMCSPTTVELMAESTPEDISRMMACSKNKAKKMQEEAKNLWDKALDSGERVEALLQKLMHTQHKDEALIIVREISAEEKEWGDDPLARELREMIAVH